MMMGQVDERHMAAREVTGAHARAIRSGANSPTASTSQAEGDLAIARHVRSPLFYQRARNITAALPASFELLFTAVVLS